MAQDAHSTVMLGGYQPVTPQREFPYCTTAHSSCNAKPASFLGPLPGAPITCAERRQTEWETVPALQEKDTTFVWIGGSQVRPTQPCAYPRAWAALTVDGQERVVFPLGVQQAYEFAQGDFRFTFEPRRFQTLVEGQHRAWNPDGVSGIYRLRVPGRRLTPGQPVRLRVEILPPGEDRQSVYYVDPRPWSDTPQLELLQAQVQMLQSDLMQLRRSHEQLYTQVRADLWPRTVRHQRTLVTVHDVKHYHPANLTLLRDGSLAIAVREAEAHFDRDGRLVLFRSRDQGATWEGPRVLFDLGQSDHRSGAIHELAGGDWVTWDYRCGQSYAADGRYAADFSVPSLWSARSTDQGRTWRFSEKPLTMPGGYAYAEVERPMIELPSGRLLMAACYCVKSASDATPDIEFWPGSGIESRIGVFASDDGGRRWDAAMHLPRPPFPIYEPTIVRTRDGRLVVLARSEGYEHMFAAEVYPNPDRGSLMQSVSEDEGRTWSAWRTTGMSSMSSPGHLLQLQDGRLLCTHAQRAHPGSIYLTVSRDDGRTWDNERRAVLTSELQTTDCGYPTTVQLADGRLVTAWYGNLFGRFYVAVARYGVEELDQAMGSDRSL